MTVTVFPQAAVRPAVSAEDEIPVGVYVGLNNIIEVDSKKQSLVTVGFIVLSWYDPRLVYNMTEPRPEFLVVPVESLWTRTFTILNSMDRQNYNPTSSDLAVIRSDGAVLLFMCPVDIRKFPFDVQSCKLMIAVLGSTYDKINIEDSQLLTEIYLVSIDWVLKNASVSVVEVKAQEIGRQVVEVTLVLARTPNFYFMSAVVPVLALSLLNPFVFALPVDHGERVSFSVALLLSYTVMLSSLSDVLPGSTEYVCYIGMLASSCIFISGSIACLVLLIARIALPFDLDDGHKKLSNVTTRAFLSKPPPAVQEMGSSRRNTNNTETNMENIYRRTDSQADIFLICLPHHTTTGRVDQGFADTQRTARANQPTDRRRLAHRINKYAFVASALVTILLNTFTFAMILA
ncbi:neuronal acetylcholine receptor subunit alpha-3 [Aplysia californica]|uniref:Neuronal acetylcholine receptor subunit alpha-3 n=1 Tax=Aplysia californica TaxID=6500 RepID=A0ABM0JH78_APLCA|nr:neuronal acetylcholine receptor subunit alpha-3 [Aplysia californica]